MLSESSKNVLLQPPSHLASEESIPERLDKRVHIALPLRVTYWDGEKKPCLDLACTYDISPRGARITRLRNVNQPGEIIAVERGRNRSFCRVIWIGERNSELQGQIGIQCVESDRLMWEAEMRDLEEQFDRLPPQNGLRRTRAAGDRNRRRQERFQLEGAVELINAGAKVHSRGGLKDLSERGCLVHLDQNLSPGTELKLVLSVRDYDLCLKGEVRHASPNPGLGIEFQEIRKGDRQMLQFLLRKLAEEQLEESFQIDTHP